MQLKKKNKKEKEAENEIEENRAVEEKAGNERVKALRKEQQYRRRQE